MIRGVLAEVYAAAILHVKACIQVLDFGSLLVSYFLLVIGLYFQSLSLVFHNRQPVL